MPLLILAARCDRVPLNHILMTQRKTLGAQKRLYFHLGELIIMLFYFTAAKYPSITLLDVDLEPRSSLTYDGPCPP